MSKCIELIMAQKWVEKSKMSFFGVDCIYGQRVLKCANEEWSVLKWKHSML